MDVSCIQCIKLFPTEITNVSKTVREMNRLHMTTSFSLCSKMFSTKRTHKTSVNNQHISQQIFRSSQNHICNNLTKKWDSCCILLGKFMKIFMFLWMHCCFMNVEGIFSFESFVTLITGVEEKAREVYCLKVMPNFGRKLWLESAA